MSRDSKIREALRHAEHGANADASRLVDGAAGLVREARRLRAARLESSATVEQVATRALPRLAAATALVVIASASIVMWERGKAAKTAPATFESVILGRDEPATGDVLFDALVDARRGDG